MTKKIKNILLFSLFFVSCNKATPILTKKEIYKKVDSIVNIRIKEIDKESERDLEHRIKIELKVKADSIINARINKTVKDPVPKNAQLFK